jgi:hypothetical protein
LGPATRDRHRPHQLALALGQLVSAPVQQVADADQLDGAIETTGSARRASRSYCFAAGRSGHGCARGRSLWGHPAGSDQVAERSPDRHAVGGHQQVATHVEVVEQLDRLEATYEASPHPLVGRQAVERHIAEDDGVVRRPR